MGENVVFFLFLRHTGSADIRIASFSVDESKDSRRLLLADCAPDRGAGVGRSGRRHAAAEQLVPEAAHERPVDLGSDEAQVGRRRRPDVCFSITTK